MPLTADAEIRDLLTAARTIALVGISDRPERASNHVMAALQDHGYRVLPLNPAITGEHIHGEYVWRELSQLGDPIDIVDVFRKSSEAGATVDAAIAIGAKAVWLQLGVVDEAAAARAEAAGLKVVMDRCIKIELARLGVAPVSPAARAPAPAARHRAGGADRRRGPASRRRGRGPPGSAG